MRVDFTRFDRRIEQMHFKVAEANVDFFHLSGLQLFFGRLDLFDNLAADHFGIKLHRLVEILGAGGEGSDSFDIEHGGLLEKRIFVIFALRYCLQVQIVKSSSSGPRETIGELTTEWWIAGVVFDLRLKGLIGLTTVRSAACAQRDGRVKLEATSANGRVVGQARSAQGRC